MPRRTEPTTPPVQPADVEVVVLAHFWTDPDGVSHKPNDPVALPKRLAQSLRASGYVRLDDDAAQVAAALTDAFSAEGGQ